MSDPIDDVSQPFRGREVSCRPLGFFFREFERLGHPTEILLDGIPLTRERITDRHARIDWETFRRFMANVGQVWDADALVAAGKRSTASRWQQQFGSVARLIVSSDEIYHWVFDPNRGVSKQLISCLNNELIPQGPGRFVCRAVMQPGYEPSREFSLICLGSMMAIPTMLGLPEANAEMRPTPGGADYTVRHSIRKSPLARLRRAVMWPFAARVAARELREANEALFKRAAELDTASVERERAQAALRESESRFYHVFHSAPTIMIVGTYDGFLLDVNDRFVTQSGYRREEVLGRRATEFDFWIDVGGRSEIVDVLKRGETVRGAETRFRTRSGEIRSALVSAEPATLDGQPCIIWQAVDITERKRAEERSRVLGERMLQTQKLEGLGVMAGGIAHDFNNLLVGILGNAELALAKLGPADEHLRRHVEAIFTASQRGADLTRSMLAYAGKAKLTTAPLELGSLVGETVALVRSGVAKETVIEVRGTDEPVWIEGDDVKVRQVVMNLLTNAAESYGQGSGTVSVRTGALSIDGDEEARARRFLGGDLAAGDYAFIEVEDRGCGMDAKTQTKIFDPFFTTKFLGRGLGLAATLGIVKGHAGALELESVPGEGTRFRVLLPRVEAPVQESATDPREVSEPARGRVLVVDDDAAVREVAQLMLESEGFSTVAAEGGNEALEILERDPGAMQVVLLDLTMPKMSGEETFHKIRGIEPDLPVICFSGYGDDVGTEWIRGKANATFVAKPFRREQLKTALGSLLGSRPDDRRVS